MTGRVPPYVLIDKQVGETPLQSIERWKKLQPQFADLPATYAGRLDPMASGKLLVLLGEECKKREQYTGLDKEYEIEVVLDLSTDTGDALGLASYAGLRTEATTWDINSSLEKLSGAHHVPYPAFSSKTVNGIPLFMYALRGELDSIAIPTHLENIYNAKLIDSKLVSKEELQTRIESKLSEVPVSEEPSKELGQDFRQHDIRSQWKKLLAEMPERTFCLLTLRVTCASGTYMRTLAMRLANEVGTTAFALSIHRTKIGRYTIIGPLKFWSKEY